MPKPRRMLNENKLSPKTVTVSETETGLDELQDYVGRLLVLLGERDTDNPSWWLKLAAAKIAIGEWGE